MRRRDSFSVQRSPQSQRFTPRFTPSFIDFFANRSIDFPRAPPHSRLLLSFLVITVKIYECFRGTTGAQFPPPPPPVRSFAPAAFSMLGAAGLCPHGDVGPGSAFRGSVLLSFGKPKPKGILEISAPGGAARRAVTALHRNSSVSAPEALQDSSSSFSPFPRPLSRCPAGYQPLSPGYLSCC